MAAMTPSLVEAGGIAAGTPSSTRRPYLRRDLAFPAFSDNSLDRDPGTGSGQWKDMNSSSGYAATVATAETRAGTASRRAEPIPALE